MMHTYPLIVETLREFGLITDAQALAAQLEYEKGWEREHEDILWWSSLADIAWRNEASLWQKLKDAWVTPTAWKLDWINERRVRV